jgi:hypothetical protein
MNLFACCRILGYSAVTHPRYASSCLHLDKSSGNDNNCPEKSQLAEVENGRPGLSGLPIYSSGLSDQFLIRYVPAPRHRRELPDLGNFDGEQPKPQICFSIV